MKFLFFGDSITDAGRDRNIGADLSLSSYGIGYVRDIAAAILKEAPDAEIYNRGIGGDRVVDLYARIKRDVWNLQPDVLSILIGVNDVWHEINNKNGVEIERYERIYRMLIEDTLKVLPNVKIVLMEPFVLKGGATETRYNEFLQVYEYAKVAKRIANDYNLYFLPLQDKFNKVAEKYPTNLYLIDGVHPQVAGAKLIADEWMKHYKEDIEKQN